jgi:hypothetical protein
MEKFDLKKEALDGLEESAFWHTVGVLASDAKGNPETGTAAAIRWADRPLLLTANHVVENTRDRDLQFFFRPDGTLARRDWWQDAGPPVRHELPEPIKILARHSCTDLDLAVLVIQADLEKNRNVKFYDVQNIGVPDPLPSSVLSIGFPSDSKEIIGPGAIAISPLVNWGNAEQNLQKRPSKFNPETHFLVKFIHAEEGRHPGGFSGAGVWYREATPEPGVWYPNLHLAGLCTHYYPGIKLLEVCKTSQLIGYLKTTFP